MVVTEKKTSASAQAKKKKSGGGKKRLTPFNKFMQTETARLKEEKPDLDSKERFKLVIENWNKQKDKA
ncbi:hypothetical protein BC629DRAFT_1591268 [Irpex lacteus]|nr:hypothetical protein BC629DRAFT_1591268 [Irpex lacteus]